MDKSVIEKNFSRYAGDYDKYASVQNLFASGLIERLRPRRPFKKILDIGCGTGNYTRLLRHKFPLAEIKAIDISSAMIKRAKDKLRDKRTEFIIADAEKILLDEKFDLITSNASFQWFENIEETVAKYAALLKKGGIILFSIFGTLTLKELNASLKELFKEEVSISSCDFAKKKAINKILKRHFKKILIKEETVKETYKSLWELLNKIKYTGARGHGINGSIILKTQISELERIYKEKFGSLAATYQVFCCKAVK